MKSKRRTLLYFPVTMEKTYKKLKDNEADAIIFDFEDAIKEDSKSKQKGREIFLKNIKHVKLIQKVKEIFIRINGIRSKHFNKDMDFINYLLKKGIIPDAIVLPKVEFDNDIFILEHILSHYESLNKINKKIEILPTIETILGEQNAKEILVSSSRITTVQIGENGDYTASFGSFNSLDIMKDPISRDYIIKILKLTRIYGLLLIDGVYFKPVNTKQNINEFRERCEYVKNLGLNGKGVIHPTQIKIANEVFSIKKEDLVHWNKIKKAYEKHLKDVNNHSAYFADGGVFIGPTWNRNANKLKKITK